jgi:hypothetical protein
VVIPLLEKITVKGPSPDDEIRKIPGLPDGGYEGAGQSHLYYVLDDHTRIGAHFWAMPGHGNRLISIEARAPGKELKALYPRPGP